MRKIIKYVWAGLKLLMIFACGVFLITLRYVLKTPQPFDSILPGYSRLYKWRHGYIFYKVIGSDEAEPLVMMHAPGVGASSYEMRRLQAQLAQRYRVYTLDLPGFGNSDHPNVEYNADLYISVLRDFLTEVVRQPAVVLASGLSCNYAIAVASEAPEVCSRLILLSPLTVYESQQRSGWLTSLVRTPLIGFSLYAFLTLRPILREVIARRHGCKYSEVMPDDLQSAYAAAHQFGAHRAVLALLAGKMDLESRRQLEGLGQPVIMIWGEKAVLALENLPAIAKDTEVVVIQESGLRPHEDRASTVVTHILDMGDGERLAGPITIEDTVVSNHQSVTVTLNQQKMETVEAVDANVFVEQPGRSVEQTLDAGVMGDEKETEDSGSLTETVENQQQEEVEAYCVKCKQKRIMQGAHRITTKNGRNAMEGSCPVCGTRLFRFIAR